MWNICVIYLIFRERREQEQRGRDRLDKERRDREREERERREKERQERERAKMRELEIQKERERQAMEDVNRHFELSMELAKKVKFLTQTSVTHNIFSLNS